MKLISISCNHCGGPLEVRKSARFVTCGFCDSRLAVHVEGNSYMTEVIERLEQHTNELHREVVNLKLRSKLDRIDRDWQHQRESLKVRNKDGHAYVPSQEGAVMVGGVAVAVSIVAGITLGSFIITLVGLIVGLGGAAVHYSHAKQYENERRRYYSRRREVMRVRSSDVGNLKIKT